MSEPGALVLEPTAGRNGGAVEVRLTARIPDGTHIESHEPAEPFLIPTVLDVENLRDATVAYPPPIEKDVGIPGVRLSVFEGTVTFVAHGEAEPAEKEVRGTLRYQPCVHGACLPPRSVAWSAAIDDRAGERRRRPGTRS